MGMRSLQVSREAATLRMRVEEKLRDAIDTGHFKPGERLIERDLCESIGVGRTSIREALCRLEGEGLVANIPYRGPTVSTISNEEARQLYELLAVLKPFGARLFAERLDDAARQQLGAALHAVKRAQTREAVMLAKSAFHAALTAGCGNDFLKQTLSFLHNKIKLLHLPSILEAGRVDRSIGELAAIHQAIIANDGPRAEAACSDHIKAAAVSTLAILREQESADRRAPAPRQPGKRIAAAAGAGKPRAGAGRRGSRS